MLACAGLARSTCAWADEPSLREIGIPAECLVLALPRVGKIGDTVEGGSPDASAFLVPYPRMQGVHRFEGSAHEEHLAGTGKAEMDRVTGTVPQVYGICNDGPVRFVFPKDHWRYPRFWLEHPRMPAPKAPRET